MLVLVANPAVTNLAFSFVSAVLSIQHNMCVKGSIWSIRVLWYALKFCTGAFPAADRSHLILLASTISNVIEEYSYRQLRGSNDARRRLPTSCFGIAMPGYNCAKCVMYADPLTTQDPRCTRRDRARQLFPTSDVDPMASLTCTDVTDYQTQNPQETTSQLKVFVCEE
jgi:hypothetical protein